MATGTADPVSRSLDNRCFVQTLPRQTITFYPAQPFTETHPKEHPQTMSGTADESPRRALLPSLCKHIKM